MEVMLISDYNLFSCIIFITDKNEKKEKEEIYNLILTLAVVSRGC